MARAHHTTLPQNDMEERPMAAEPHVSRSPANRGATETWLVVAGILMMLVGIALVVLPTVLPRYTWIVHSLAARGVTSLPIAIGGVLMCGIAFAGRSRLDAPPPLVDPDRGTRTALDTLSQQIAQLGDALQGIRIEFVYLKDALQSQFDRVEASRGADNAGDAVYRLAASLDQVGMRIEDRVATTNREVTESVKSVVATLEALREESAGLKKQIDEVRHTAEESQPPRHPLDDADEAYAEDWPGEEHERAPHGSRLGLLDMLDDLGRLLPRKDEVETPIESERDPFEGSRDEGWKHAASVPAALPSLPRDEARIAEPIGLLGRGMPRSEPPAPDEPLGEKLEELRGLLADSRVREALAALERSRR